MPADDRRLAEILLDGVAQGAAAIVFASGSKPFFQIGSQWMPSRKDREYDSIEVQEFLWQIMDVKLQNRFFTAQTLEFDYHLKNSPILKVTVEKKGERIKALFTVQYEEEKCEESCDEEMFPVAAGSGNTVSEEPFKKSAFGLSGSSGDHDGEAELAIDLDNLDLDFGKGFSAGNSNSSEIHNRKPEIENHSVQSLPVSAGNSSLTPSIREYPDYGTGGSVNSSGKVDGAGSSQIHSRKSQIMPPPVSAASSPSSSNGLQTFSKSDSSMSVNVPSPQRQNTGSSPKPASAVVSRPRVRYPVTIMELLHHAFEIGASDLHIGASMPPLFRVDGELKEGPFPLLTGDHTELLLSEVVSQENRSRLLEEKELDIGFDLPGRCRLRGNVFFEQGRWAGVFRIIPPFIRTLDELGAPKIFKAMMKRHKGMILFTGPTGSGKSTSLAAMIDYINRLKNIHILTIEDPVEFIHNPVKARITHRELGKDTLSFSEGLKRALRQDPDVILVGEMRDLETIQLAIMAAETGHLVLSTLHTSSAAKSIHRIIDVFPTDQQSQIRMTLSENLIAIIAQSLVPHSTGTGRVAAYEIMVNTSAVANLIREEKVFQIPSVIETQSQFGMISMDQSLMKLVETGSISVKEALLRATETKIMRDRLIKMGYIENPQTLQQDGISDTLKSGDN